MGGKPLMYPEDISHSDTTDGRPIRSGSAAIHYVILIDDESCLTSYYSISIINSCNFLITY
jgi:hypothetical protein